MKTLVNKNNPQIRITAPEIEISKLFDGSKVYWIPSIHELCGSFSPDNWTLVEEEPVDLENEAVAFCFDNGINITPYQATRIAHHFYELGLKVRKVPTISTTNVPEEIKPEAFKASMGKIWDFLKRFKEYKEQKNK